MASLDDLRQAILTAVAHLNSGGVLLVAAKTEETFQNNNFAYTGEKDGVHVTLFENNYINPFHPNTYEATLIYLIREHGALTIHTENQVLGLFSQAAWDQVFKDAGIEMKRSTLNGVYDKFILNDGEYPLTVYVGRKV